MVDNDHTFRITLKDIYKRQELFEDRVITRLIEIEKDLSGLKVKSGVWGILGALLVVIPTVLGLALFVGGR